MLRDFLNSSRYGLKKRFGRRTVLPQRPIVLPVIKQRHDGVVFRRLHGYKDFLERHAVIFAAQIRPLRIAGPGSIDHESVRRDEPGVMHGNIGMNSKTFAIEQVTLHRDRAIFEAQSSPAALNLGRQGPRRVRAAMLQNKAGLPAVERHSMSGCFFEPFAESHRTKFRFRSVLSTTYSYRTRDFSSSRRK